MKRPVLDHWWQTETGWPIAGKPVGLGTLPVKYGSPTVPMPGYDLQVLRLTNSATPGPKPKLFVHGAIHAREYTTAELVTRFGEELVAGYGIDPDATWLLDHHDSVAQQAAVAGLPQRTLYRKVRQHGLR